MLRLTLAQMRRSLGRLTAAGLAIVLGTAFVAATLIAGAVITRTSHDAITASYARADLVVTPPPGGSLTGSDLASTARTDGVAAADGAYQLWVEFVASPKKVYQQVAKVASDPRLEAQVLVRGALPNRSGEVAIPRPLAERLGLDVGGSLTADVPVATQDGSSFAAEQLTVVGIVTDPSGAFAQSGGAVVASGQDADRWAQSYADGSAAAYASAVVALAPGADLERVRSAIAAAVPAGTTVLTRDEKATAVTAELTDGANVFTTIVLGFAAVAMLVAALVIANTFQVLIAQRTRTLALLRCVGADKRQLRRSVLIEAGLLGLASSLVGLVVGAGLAQIALTVLGRMNLDVPLPSTISVTAAVVLAPRAVGTLITVLAALAPARAATRVAPLAALRPADAPVLSQRRNVPRLVLASLLTVGGAALLVFAVVAGRQLGDLAGLGIGVLGGASSFVGVLVGSVFWVPSVVGRAGRLFAGTGTSARLAAANAVRNPRRTAATSTALLIGVTLVAMMSTGAASARSTLDGALDDHFPVDVAIGRDLSMFDADGGEAATLVTPALVSTVERVPGVADVVALRGLTLDLGGRPEPREVSASVLTTGEAASVLRSPSLAAGLDDTHLVLATDTAKNLGIVDGEVLTVGGTAEASDGSLSPAGTAVQLTAVVTGLPDGALLTPGALGRMGIELPTSQVWARLAQTRDASTVVPAIEDALSVTAVQITGAAVERAQYQRIIDTLLAVVLGLLAVAVVIALIGVANTLSLSVIERRRESATLRALGLTRRQLRATLAIEGMLISGVGAVLGGLLGTLYGWAGAATVLGVIGEVRLDIPWRDLALVVVVALAAGLLASVLPGRAAARTSPVAALAVD